MYGTVRDNQGCGINNPDFHSILLPVLEEAFPFAIPVIQKNHIVYSDRDYSRYKNKRLLILGGGGSTQRFLDKLPNLAEYDFVWSMNAFYKNDCIRNNLRVDLFSVGPDIDFKDQILLDYLYKHGTIAAHELHDKWARKIPGNNLAELRKEVQDFYDDEYKIAFQTKFYSQLGGGVRLIIFAGEVGFSEIHFSGFDGPIPIWNKDHAFEKGKDKLPSSVRYMSREQIIKLFQHQYDLFWRYIKELYPDLKLKPLEDNVMHRNLL